MKNSALMKAVEHMILAGGLQKIPVPGIEEDAQGGTSSKASRRGNSRG